MKHKSLGLCVAVAAGACALVTGCADEPAPAPVVVAPPPLPPAEPPKPAVTPVEQLMAELNIDPRVAMAEEKAPPTDEERKAVLVFFDAIARGNASAFKGMLSLTDQVELDALTDSGAWKDATSKVSRIEVQTGNHESEKCALAVIETGSGMNISFQPQLWYYTVEGEAPTFEAAATPPGIMDKLSGADWIASWHEILAEEARLAEQPDEEVEIAQRTVETGDRGGSNISAGGGPGGLRDPGGSPGRAPPDPGSPGGR